MPLGQVWCSCSYIGLTEVSGNRHARAWPVLLPPNHDVRGGVTVNQSPAAQGRILGFRTVWRTTAGLRMGFRLRG